MPSICISSGHSAYVSGAVGLLSEVTEARRVVDQVEVLLSLQGIDVSAFHDDTSKTQKENLNTIVAYHNAQTRDLDVSVHFNAGQQPTDAPRGTECLYLSQKTIAEKMSRAIAHSGLKDRGAKLREDLYFLNATDKPAILIEVCFVDSAEDAAIYHNEFNTICDSIARVLYEAVGGSVPTVSIDIAVPEGLKLQIYVNGKLI